MSDWQLLLVVPIVMGAAAYLGRVGWRVWRGGKGGCGGGNCACPGKVTEHNERLIPIKDIVLRRPSSRNE